jgi:membrane protein required for colicin V production
VTSLKIIDYVCIGLALLLVIRGALRGFISEFMTIASVALGALGSLFLYRPGADFLRTRGLQAFVEGLPDVLHRMLPGLVRNIPEIIAFILIFAGIFLMVKLVEYLLKDIIQRVSLGGVDRFLGLLFGLAEGLALISLLLLALKLQPVFDTESLLEGSFFAGLLLPLITRPQSLNPALPVSVVPAVWGGWGAGALNLARRLGGAVCSKIS